MTYSAQLEKYLVGVMSSLLMESAEDEDDKDTPYEDHTKNPYHKVLTKHGFKHQKSHKWQFSTYRQKIDRHEYAHSNGDTVDVGINHNPRDDSHPPKMWTLNKGGEQNIERYQRSGEKRGRKASDLDLRLSENT